MVKSIYYKPFWGFYKHFLLKLYKKKTRSCPGLENKELKSVLEDYCRYTDNCWGLRCREFIQQIAQSCQSYTYSYKIMSGHLEARKKQWHPIIHIHFQLCASPQILKFLKCCLILKYVYFSDSASLIFQTCYLLTISLILQVGPRYIKQKF